MAARSKITTCVHCRQMKLKCDSRERFPEACSRCTKHKLDCSIDPSFKRTAKRERMKALERELQDMKATTKTSDAATGPLRNNNPPSLFVSRNTVIPESSEILAASPVPLREDPQHPFQTQRLDDIELQAADIRDLIQRYYSHYHQQFPILPDIAAFAKSYDRCPLLLWTIIAIGSKYSTQFSHIYVPLSFSVPRLVADLNVVTSQTLETVQALLILCWWPFPFRATVNDPSWTYCGIATHRALQFGIHRARHHSDFFYERHLDEDVVIVHQKTWLGCYITSQILSSHLGIPTTIQPDNTVIDALAMRFPWLPIVLEHHLRIAYQSQQVCQTLGNHVMTSTGLHPNNSTIMQMFESQLRALEAQIRPDWSIFTQVAFWRLELQLYSFAFPGRNSFTNTESTLATGFSELLARGGISAMSLIHAATSFPDSNSLWNNIVRVGVGYAVFFLLKVSSSRDLHLVDSVAARNSISRAWNFLRRGSEMEDDHFTRICSIIEYLSRTSGEARKGDLTLIVRSRMSANLLWDAAWRAKDRFSQSVKDSRPDDYTSEAAVESLLQMGLDFEMAPFMDQIESGWNFLI